MCVLRTEGISLLSFNMTVEDRKCLIQAGAFKIFREY